MTPPERRLRVARTRAHLAAAAALGASALFVLPGHAPALSWEECAARARPVLESLLPEAERAGVRLAVEPVSQLRMDLGFLHSFHDALDFVDAVGSPWLGVVLELNNAWIERGLYDNIRRRRDRIAVVQISDFKVGTLAASERVVIGDGDIPLQRICHALERGRLRRLVRHRAARSGDRGRGLRLRRAARPGVLSGAVGLTPASRRVDAAGLALRCLVWGRDADPTVVLVHGNGGHAHWWTPLVPALVPGWRVVVPDLRGHGESDWPAAPSYRLDDLLGDLEAIRRALAPGPVAIAGHSMGGRVALAYAARQPVRGLALLDTHLGGVDADIAARWRGRVAGRRAGTSHPTREAAIAAFRFVPDERDVPPETIALLAAHAVRERAPGDWTFRFDRAVLSLDGDGGGDLSGALAGVACPVWLASGARSWVMDAAERARMAAARPGSRPEVFPGGHHFLVAHPVAAGSALRRFLDGLA